MGTCCHHGGGIMLSGRSLLVNKYVGTLGIWVVWSACGREWEGDPTNACASTMQWVGYGGGRHLIF